MLPTQDQSSGSGQLRSLVRKVVTKHDLLNLAILAMRVLPLSAPRRRRMGQQLGQFLYSWRPKERRDVQAAMRRAGVPPKECAEDSPELRRFYRDRFSRHSELFWLGRPQSALASLPEVTALRVDGLGYLETALEAGNGAILWEAFFGDRLLAKVLLIERGFPLIQLHGRGHGTSRTWTGRVSRPVHRWLARKLYDEVLEIEQGRFANVRRIVSLLESNRILCVASLGDTGQRFAAVPFLGCTCYFPTSIFTVARQTGAPVIPFFCYSEGDDLRLVLDPPLPTGVNSVQDSVLSYVDRLESLILSSPHQWAGWHGAIGTAMPSDVRIEDFRPPAEARAASKRHSL